MVIETSARIKCVWTEFSWSEHNIRLIEISNSIRMRIVCASSVVKSIIERGKNHHESDHTLHYIIQSNVIKSNANANANNQSIDYLVKCYLKCDTESYSVIRRRVHSIDRIITIVITRIKKQVHNLVLLRVKS